MLGKYTIKGTSRDSATVQDVVLPSSDSAGRDTRRIARAQIVANKKDLDHSVKVSLIHQRKSPKTGMWEDCPPFSQATLKAGEEVRFHLDSMETWHLYQMLRQLLAVDPTTLPHRERELLVLDANSTHVLEGKAREIALDFERHGKHLWDAIDTFRPNVLDAAAQHVSLQHRRRAVADFRQHLTKQDWSEDEWDDFFDANLWIFGHTLSYRILRDVQRQPTYGAVTVRGSGAQKGDRLMASEAAARFTVLVELKKPQTALMDKTPYRNDAYRISGDLAGGVAQLQANCRTWVVEGSRQEKNARDLNRLGIETYEPKGILVIGHCKQLADAEQRASFEVFRRNLHNPEIITYDELLARAQFFVAAPPLAAQPIPG